MTVAKRYAEKFVAEYPVKNIKGREFWFTVKGLPNTRLWNGEAAFGPVETWPAQMDDLAWLVADTHSHRKVDYQTLKNILLLEHPKIIERDYLGKKEYEDTIELMFATMITGMYNGKLRRMVNKKIKNKKINSGLVDRVFTSDKERKEEVLQEPQIQARIKYLEKMSPQIWANYPYTSETRFRYIV